MNSEAKLQRRTFLKALGIGLSVPLALQFSRMAVAQPSRPKRMILFYFPHGMPAEHADCEPYLMPSTEIFKNHGADPSQAGWNPVKDVAVHPDYVLATRSGFNLLEPLAPYRDQLSIVRGLYQAGNFGTHDSIGAVLTGDGASPSLDQVAANVLSSRALNLGAATQVNDQLDRTNGVLTRDEADWLAADNDVVGAYDQLFGSVAPTEPTEPTTDESVFREAALQLTIDEVTQMRQAVSGLTQADNKLASHLAALENVKAGGGSLGMATGDACNAAPEIPHLDDLRAQKAGEGSTPYWRAGSIQGTNFTKLAEAQSELAAHAVLCGQAQVATVQNGWASADYPLPAILPTRPNDSYHVQVSHQSYNGNLEDTFRMDYAGVQKWFMTRVARMCEILNQPDPFDPEHTALENTIIYCFSEIADGQDHGKRLQRMWYGPMESHIYQYYPAFVIGGGGGSLASGRLITVDNRPIADLLLTLAQAMGSNATSFSSNSTGPIGELLA